MSHQDKETCPAAIIDRATGNLTLCIMEVGHKGRHSDGCLEWGDPPSWSPKYLHQVGPHVSYLDNRVLPEVRAMFAAMMSRVPQGGIAARYRQVIEKIADHLTEEAGYPPLQELLPNRADDYNGFMEDAEQHLCAYVGGPNKAKDVARTIYQSRHPEGPSWVLFKHRAAAPTGVGSSAEYMHILLEEAKGLLGKPRLHPVIQTFFDKFVKKYGHSSILELTGQPVVFIEHISPWMAYLTFDNPLVRGQEMSTRAVLRMVRCPACLGEKEVGQGPPIPQGPGVYKRDTVPCPNCNGTGVIPDWPAASDTAATVQQLKNMKDPRFENTPAHLAEMHNLGLQMAIAEMFAWRPELRADCPECLGDGYLGEGYKNPDLRLTEDTFGQPTQRCPCCKGTGKKYPEMWVRCDCDSGSRIIENNENGVVGMLCSDCKGSGWVLKDPQGFRPAFDRARWALPGTIETGVAHTADLRTMARVIKQMEDIAEVGGQHAALLIIEEIKEAYRQALPGMAGMGLRESVYTSHPSPSTTPEVMQSLPGDAGTTTRARSRQLPGHLNILDPEGAPLYTPPLGSSIVPVGWPLRHVENDNCYARRHRRSYVDPTFNHAYRVHVGLGCSWACARDWHRHRTFYPWRIRVVRECTGCLMGSMQPLGNTDPERVHSWSSDTYGRLIIDHRYEPISEFGKANIERYLKLCTELFDRAMNEGNQWTAMVCLPLGAAVEMCGQGGLRDAVYMTELRGYVAGANFEYREDARRLLTWIEDMVRKAVPEHEELLGFHIPHHD